MVNNKIHKSADISKKPQWEKIHMSGTMHRLEKCKSWKNCVISKDVYIDKNVVVGITAKFRIQH